jgi:hypothetical protein
MADTSSTPLGYTGSGTVKDKTTSSTDFTKEIAKAKTSPPTGTASQSDKEKIKKLYMWDRAAQTLSASASAVNEASSRLLHMSEAQTVKYAPYIVSIQNQTTSIQRSISNFEKSIDTAFDNLLKTCPKGISDKTGSVLGPLTDALNDPLGPKGFPHLIGNLIDTIAPGERDKLGNKIEQSKLENLKKLPSQVAASVDHFITAVDNLLAIPLAFAAELYYGAIAIIKQVGQLISSLQQKLVKFVMSYLDELIGLSDIIAFLQAVNNFTSQINGIASIFTGTNNITNALQTFSIYSTQLQSYLTNPINLVVRAIPPEVNQYIEILQNPEVTLIKYLPPQIAQGFQQISKITGFGLNGNMGYPLESILNATRQGVVRGLLTSFSSQYSFLAPLLAGRANNVDMSNPKLDHGVWVPGSYNKDEFKPLTQYNSKYSPGTFAP